MSQAYLRAVLDAMPVPIFVVDEGFQVLDHNAAARPLLAVAPDALGQRGGHVLHCINAASTDRGCGHSPYCAGCGLRAAFTSAVRTERVVHARATMRLVRRGVPRDQDFQVSVIPFEQDRQPRWLIVLQDRTQIAELERLLPVCPGCYEPRASEDLSEAARAYLAKHWENDFSGCWCDDCRTRFGARAAGARNQTG